MEFSENLNKKRLKQLEETIARAIKKVGVSKENDLCRYLPPDREEGEGPKEGEGHMHHFTFRKKKYKNPDELAKTIEDNINKINTPKVISPKKRAPRGLKFKDQFTFTRMQLERMRAIAIKHANKEEDIDKEIIKILTRPKPIAAYKRELISLIKQGKVDHDLWNSYTEAVSISNQEVPVR